MIIRKKDTKKNLDLWKSTCENHPTLELKYLVLGHSSGLSFGLGL